MSTEPKFSTHFNYFNIYELLKFHAELKKQFYNIEAWSRGYKTFFMLSSTETKIYPAQKCLKCQQLSAF